MKKIIAIICLVFLSACGEPDITGRWIEPLPTIADDAPVQVFNREKSLRKNP